MPTPVSYSSMIRNQIAFDLAISDVDRKQNRIVISASTKEIFDKVYDFASQGCSTWLVNDKGETLNLDIIGVNEAKV
jgi:hypothetical protein